MTHPANTLSLVADIGGTNTRVALADGARLIETSIRRYRNADYGDLETVLRQYIADEDHVDPAATCVALAGPVRDGVGQMTNLDWAIDHDTLKRATSAEHTAILNDLQAQGHAIGQIDTVNLRTIVSGPQAAKTATKLVIGLGTGFNATAVFDDTTPRYVAASECGHVNLPVVTSDDLNLAQFLETERGFAAAEDILSGRGLANIYSWLSTTSGAATDKDPADIMAAVADGSDTQAIETVKHFCRYLGLVAGNLALTHLPFGGIYLVGGVSNAIAPYLAEYGFTEALRDKGRFADFMTNFSVTVVQDDYAALTGCASYLNATR